MTSSAKPLRILSLDGGGYRGLSTLIMLQGLMLAYKEHFNRPEIPRPCEIFDFIIGTSTGGLIALLVGRLGLHAKDAIDIYLNLGKDIFSKDNQTSLLNWAASGKGKFDAHKYAEYISSVIPPSETMLLQTDPRVRTAVTTVLVNQPSSEPILLRNYVNMRGSVPPNVEHAWTIVEAARATSAAPTYFEPLPVGTYAYQDAGAGGFNNPALAALLELGRIEEWKGRYICAFVSLGTGMSAKLYNPAPEAPDMQPSRGIGAIFQKTVSTIKSVISTATDATKVALNAPDARRRGTDMLEYLTNVATDSERAHVIVQALHPKAYFRFNVPVDQLPPPGSIIEGESIKGPDGSVAALGDIDLADVSQEERIKKLTEGYLLNKEVKEYMAEAIKRLDRDWTPSEA